MSRLDEKDVVNSKTNKYVLTTQQQLDEGDMETRLFKVNFIIDAFYTELRILICGIS